MKTTILYENGNTFRLTYRPAIDNDLTKKYFSIGENIFEVVSKIKLNNVTITEQISQQVRPR